jgi:hypothetical protein
MAIDVRAYCGSDDAFVAWTSDFIANCRGFSLRRKIKHGINSVPSPNTEMTDASGYAEEIVATWVGFQNGPDFPAGTRKPSTEWPIQKYLWTDYAVTTGDRVSYKVTPVIRGSSGELVELPDQSSGWTEELVLEADAGGGISCYFNRGIVASQWLSRLLPHDDDIKKDRSKKAKRLRTIIRTPGDRTRNFLGGPVRDRLVGLLTEAAQKKQHVYAALYELEDPELIPLLAALKKRAHVVLGNGSVKKKGEDQNADARQELTGVCDVRDRMTAPRALAHNKFLVVCDANDKNKALKVWTGSTNWTMTGLCTQANNALLIENRAIAGHYLAQWHALSKLGPASPDEFKEANEAPRSPVPKGVTLWFTPMQEQSDLEAAQELILAGKQGIMFLMFNPGPLGTLLNVIIERASPAGSHYNPSLYIQGVVNQNPGTEKKPGHSVSSKRTHRGQCRRRVAGCHRREIEILGAGATETPENLGDGAQQGCRLGPIWRPSRCDDRFA